MRFRKSLAVSILAIATLCAGVLPSLSAPGRSHISATPAPTPVPAVISVTVISLERAASILRGLYPRARISADRASNSIIIMASPDEVQAMRTVIQGIDVKNPTQPTLEIVALHVLKSKNVISRLRSLYPNAQIAPASAASLFVKANPLDMVQIKTLIGTLDAPPTAAVAPSSPPAEALRVTQSNPRDDARAIARQIPHIRASVAGSSVIVVGSAEDIAKAKTLMSTIDQPAFGSRYTQIYRIKNIDAGSVASLVSPSYPNTRVNVDRELNALSVYATASEHQRIADAIAQLDAGTSAGNAPGSANGAAYGSSNIEVVDLKSAMPGMGQGQNSTTASDIGQAVTQSLQGLAPDLHVTVQANTTSIILSGSPQSIRLARDLIDRLDRTPPLVVLDTEILELDENVARDLGLSLANATLSSGFQELPPPSDLNGQPGRLIRLQPLGRTPLSFTAVLNLLIQKGNARILADPRITTISGRTATIRAGDTIGILTQTAGGPGTPITQQLQSFNTGVTLDITPIVNADNMITVALHPVVNSLSAVQFSSIPTISTRDTQTVVHLANNETLVIGGLIQEVQSKSASKIPIAGDIPFLGRLFRSENINYTRNELIMVVTPHIVVPGEPASAPSAALPGIPTPRPLPTLPPYTQLPNGAPRINITPQPVSVPIPAPLSSEPSPAQRASSPPNGASFHTPQASATPEAQRTPSAFASANVFEYGQAPQNTYAGESDSPQIFYASFSPTIVRQGQPVSISVITTTNVKRVTIGVPGYATTLAQVAPSKWQATYNFSTSGIMSSQSTVNLTLNAYRSDSVSAAIQIPISLLSNQ